MTDLSKLRGFGSSERDEQIQRILEEPDRVTASTEAFRRQMEMQQEAVNRANRPGDLLEEVLEAQHTTNGLLSDLVSEIKILRQVMEGANGRS